MRKRVGEFLENLRSAPAGALLLFWALLITWLFLAPRGLRVPGVPQLNPAGHLLPMLTVWSNLFSGGGWSWMVGTDTWLGIGLGAAGLLAMTLVGRLFIRCFQVYFAPLVLWPLSFAMGVGVCGVVFTILGLLGLLYQWLALLVYFLVLGVLLAVNARMDARVGKREGGAERPGDKPLHAGFAVRKAKDDLAIEWEQATFMPVAGFFERALAPVLVMLFTAIQALVFYHALFYPVTDWDSLILYVGHARQIFYEHAFPVQVVMQVGVGLGSNYPHLFEITGATIATWFNRFDPLYLQLASPVAGLCVLLIVYHTALRLARSFWIALIVVVLFRAVPHLIAYNIYASNYAFAMLYAAAFLYCALRYIEDGLRGYFILATLCAAFGVYVNYLMGALWLCWVVMVVVAHWPPRPITRWEADFGRDFAAPDNEVLDPPDYVSVDRMPPLSWLMRDKKFWTITAIGVAVASVWYLRNWVVTGNPVYAFFTWLFPGTKHFNPEVLESANQEWQRHGAGIGAMGATLFQRVAGSWSFFVNDYKGGNFCWRWAPSVVGLAFPGALILVGTIIVQTIRPRKQPNTNEAVRVWDDSTRLGVVALTLAVILFAYHYMMGPFYLYHLLPAFAAFGVFMVFALRACPRRILWAFGLWAAFCALIPGLPMAMMGQKQTGRAGFALQALRNPGMSERVFYEAKWGDLPRLWDEVNRRAVGTPLLTHENRRLLFDPSIEFLHMDNWEIQELWDKSDAEKLRALERMGVRYYLRVPFEFDHPINARLGHRKWIEQGVLREVMIVADKDHNAHVLYEFDYDKAW